MKGSSAAKRRIPRGVPLADVPKLSLLRAGAASPTGLALIMASRLWKTSSRPLVPRPFLPYLLGLLLLVTTTALSFTSTILLSDVALGTGLRAVPGFETSAAALAAANGSGGSGGYGGSDGSGVGTNTSTLRYDFRYGSETADGFVASGWWTNALPRLSSWVRGSTVWPAFAEEQVQVSSSDPSSSSPLPAPLTPFGAPVDSTGLLRRALLPFPRAETRSALHSYRGPLLGLDASVLCVAPDFFVVTNVSSRGRVGLGGVSGGDLVEGRVRAPRGIGTGSGDRGRGRGGGLWVVPGVEDSDDNDGVPFACSFHTNPYHLTLCQLDSSVGGLVSSFSNQSDAEVARVAKLAREYPVDPEALDFSATVASFFATWGPAYLVLLTTVGILGRTDTERTGVNLFRGGWRDVSEEVRGVGQGNPPEWVDLVSLCFTAWDAAPLVDAVASSPRPPGPEPVAVAGISKDDYSAYAGGLADAVRQYDVRLPLSERGAVLDLAIGVGGSANAGATPPPTPLGASGPGFVPVNQSARSLPFVALFGDASGESTASYRDLNTVALPGNRTMVVQGRYTRVVADQPKQYFTADPAVSAFFWQHLNATRSIAHTLSAAITLLSSAAYYEQAALFDRAADAGDATAQLFVAQLYPQGFAGYAVVAGICVAHLALVAVCVVVFVRTTRHSLLGNTWSAVAQVAVPEVLAGERDDDRRRIRGGVEEDG